MAKRMPTKLFVRELEAALNRGDGYIMASYGQNPRTGYLDLTRTDVKSAWKENGWYYTQYSGAQRTQALKWRKKCTRVWDCNGMAEGIYEIYSGVCINARARNNYASWCSVKGKGVIPANRRVPGAAVFWGSSASSIHHVAYLWKPFTAGKPEGDWYLIEARGVMTGVVETRLLSRKPDFWGLMTKYFAYPGIEAQGVALGDRTLQNGDEGEDVRQLQTNLIRLGYDCGKWGADGDFGDGTELAVKAFQRDHGLAADGIAGAKTIASLEKALAKANTPSGSPRLVEIVGGNCYVRNAPNTGGAKLGVAHAGDRLMWLGEIDEATRWLKVDYEGRAGWVSGKYGKLV